MAEPIARAIVRDVEQLVWEAFSLELDHEQRERLIHQVDAHIKRGVCRLLEEPAAELVSATAGH